MAFRINVCITLLLLQVFGRDPRSHALVCPISMDTVFLLDGSSSIGTINFNKLKEFIINVLQYFKISDKESHFGLVLYSDSGSIKVSFKDPQTLPSIVTKIRDIAFTGGNTYTGRGLDTTGTVFTQGGRGHVPRVVVVINDGKSSGGDLAKSAQNLKNDSITIISIGVGSGISMNELHLIASSSSHVYTYSSADDLRTRVAAIVRSICAVSRQPYLYFTSITENALMINHVITNVQVTDDLQCTLKCLNNESCFSFNYLERSRMCQLNYSNKQATPDDVISDDQSIHYDMTFR